MKSRTVSKMNIWPVVTFVTVLFFQIALNMFVEAPQYIPDELGAVSIGARIAGYDWTYILSKRNMYYGYGSATIFFPFFFMTKDSILLYRMLLAGGAVWRSLPVFICFKIGKDYFDIKNNLMLSALSIIGVLATPSRATRSDNEPMLVLLGWLIF